MDKRFLKTYSLTVKTLSPIHIGSGVKLSRIADFLTTNGRVLVIDESKLLDWISRQNDAERLSMVLADMLRDKKKGIQAFINNEQVKSRLKLSDVITYALAVTGQPREISSFIKTAEHQPYLPGSSMKGSLRNALLRGVMIENIGLQESAQQLIKKGAPHTTNSGRIEAKLFSPAMPKENKAPNFDINRLMLIRDSSPLPVETLRIVLVRVLSVNGSGRLSWKKTPYGDKNMEIYIEALPSNTSITMDVTWQTQLLDQLAAELGFVNAEHLMVFLPEYCRRASRELLAQEYDFYQRHGQKDLITWFADRLRELDSLPEGTFYLPIGWGSGFDAKTVTDLLGENTFRRVVEAYKHTKGLGKPGRNKDAQWLGPKDSPKSRKVVVNINDSLEPLGWVELRFLPLDTTQDWLRVEREALKNKKPKYNATKLEAPTLSPPYSFPAPSDGLISAPVPKPTPKPMIERFTSIPKVGDRFQGIVFYRSDLGVMLEIPGLDADTQAYALIPAHAAGTLYKKVEEGKEILCEVTAVTEKQRGYWCVECKLG